MKNLFIPMALASFSLLSADYYQPYSSGQEIIYEPYTSYQPYMSSSPMYNDQFPQDASELYQPNYPNAEPYMFQGERFNQNAQPYFNPNPNFQDTEYYKGTQYYQQQGMPTYQGSPKTSYVPQTKSDNNFSNQAQNYQSISDKELAKRIKDKIGAGWLTKGYKDVTYDVNDGIVVLRGSVETPEDKTKVEEEVRDINGVRRVSSMINVTGKKSVAAPSYKSYNAYQPYNLADNSKKIREMETKFPNDKAATENDRVINAKIREKLNGSWFTKNYENIAISTVNGSVTVTGTVDNSNDIKKITDDIKRIDGVVNVANQVTVKPKTTYNY